MVRVMAAMDRSEFELSWMGFGPVREALVERAGRKVSIHPWARNVGGGIEPALIAQIAARLRRLAPDVVHIHNWSTSLYGIAAARLAQVPVVLYGLGGQTSTDAPPARRAQAMRVLGPQVDRFTSVCDWLGDYIAEHWDVSRDRVDVLRTGIDLKPIDKAPDGAEVRADLGLPPDARVVGTVSVLRPVKRIPDLVAAMGIVAKTHPNAHLVLFGNALGVAPDDLRKQAAALGIADRLHLFGRVEAPAQVLPVFDVFVNCSEFEGTSNAILEAMAARIPVVATNVGGTPEIVTDGVEGRLVPVGASPALAEAIVSYLDDEDRSRTAGEAGRRRIETQHTLRTMIDAYLDFYRRAADLADDARPRTIVRSAAATVESVRRLVA